MIYHGVLTWAVRCFKVDRVLLSWETAADSAGTLSVQLSLLAGSEEGACTPVAIRVTESTNG